MKNKDWKFFGGDQKPILTWICTKSFGYQGFDFVFGKEYEFFSDDQISKITDFEALAALIGVSVGYLKEHFSLNQNRQG